GGGEADDFGVRVLGYDLLVRGAGCAMGLVENQDVGNRRIASSLGIAWVQLRDKRLDRSHLHLLREVDARSGLDNSVRDVVLSEPCRRLGHQLTTMCKKYRVRAFGHGAYKPMREHGGLAAARRQHEKD